MVTIVDRLIPCWYWCKCGLAEISTPMSIFNFLMIISLVFNNKGIDIPLAVMGVFLILTLGVFTFIGWFGQTYDIYSRINSLINQKSNPEIKQISDDVKVLKQYASVNMLGEYAMMEKWYEINYGGDKNE